MTIRVIPGTIIATCILGWWIPQVNTGLRYITILIFVGYTVIGVLLTLRNRIFRRVVIIYGGGSIGLLFAPSWMVPIVALPAILFTVAYLDIGAQIIPHYLRHGRLPAPEAGQPERRDRPDGIVPPPAHRSPRPGQRRQYSRQMEPDLDTDSLLRDIWR